MPRREWIGCSTALGSGGALEPKPGPSLIHIWVCGLSLVFGFSVHADEAKPQGWNGHTVSLLVANDALGNTDRHYTHGAGLYYLSPDITQPKKLLAISECLPAAGVHKEAQQFGFGITQEIYTPEDLHAEAVLVNDRPYAGWFYGTFCLERRGMGWFHKPARDVWGVQLGVIGPPSFAEQAQNIVHHDPLPGWRNQLEFEPGLVVFYKRVSLFRFQLPGSGWALDFLPSFGGAAGNVQVNAYLRTEFRFGYHIDDEFAIPHPSLSTRGVYFFVSAEGRGVVRNVFLDGNTFRTSHSVDKTPFVGNFTVGLTAIWKHLQGSAAATRRTHEFEQQDDHDTFFSAQVTLRF